MEMRDAHKAPPRPRVQRRVLVTGGSGFIGTHLVACLQRCADSEVLNVDVQVPTSKSLKPLWVHGDILDRSRLHEIVHEFLPSHVVHLAARTDVSSASIDDYAVNISGVANLLDVVAATSCVERLLLASTQFVCRPGHYPAHDEDYMPHTAYGRSKVIAEQAVRSSDLPIGWIILRPTTVWGPGDLAYRYQFYRAIAGGYYLHPSGAPYSRSLGFVENVVAQMCLLMKASPGLVERRTFYLGDAESDLDAFADEFSRQIRGRPARRAPAPLIRGIGLAGDVVTRVGLNFPLTTGRYLSMTENYPVPIDRTLELTGAGPFSLKEGVRQTVSWLRREGILR
jgi:GlcNAc-P-P-Und epimerase